MIKKSDVCVITTIHPPFEKRIWDRCALEYVNNGMSVTLIAPWPISSNAVTQLKTYASPNRLFRPFNLISTAIKVIKTDAKIYHFHDLDFLPIATVIKFLTGRQFIYDCHENYPEEIINGKEWIPKYARGALSHLVRRTENYCSRIIKNVIVVVPNQISRFSKNGCNTEIIRNLSAFPSQRLPEDIPIQINIAYFGTISPDYGLNTLIEIAQSLPDNATLHIAAKGQKHHIDSLKSAISDLDRVMIYESASKEKIQELGSICNIGLSLEQNLETKILAYPAKLFEYMAFNLAVISSDLKGNKEILGSEGVALYSDPDRAKDYVKHIIDLCSNPERVLLMQKESNLRHKNLYSWSKEGQKLVSYTAKIGDIKI